MPSLRGTPRPAHLCTATCTQRLGEGLALAEAWQGWARPEHAWQAESSQRTPALGASISAVALWPRPQPHGQKAGHAGCSVPRRRAS